MADPLVRIRFQGDEAVQGADRVSRALSRMERSEPTRALRATRAAVDELAASASGLDPRLGRLASVFAQFGIGGVVGLAAVAGFAAIGAEIKTLIEYTSGLDERAQKLNATFSALVPTAAKLQALGTLREKAEEGPPQPSIFMRLFARLEDFGTRGGTGQLSEAISLEQEMAFRTMGLRLDLMQRQADAERNRAEYAGVQERQRPEIEAEFGVRRARLGLHPSAIALLDFTHALDAMHIALGKGDAATRLRLEHLSAEAYLVERSNLLMARREAHTGIEKGGLETFLLTGEQRRERLDEEQQRAAKQALVGGGRSTLVQELAPLISASFAAFAAFSGGGSAAQVGALGGIASGLSGLKKLSPGASDALGIGGIILSGLSSLFGGGQPKVIISAFEGQALTEIRNLRGDPLTSQFIVVGNDPRGTQYALSRLQRRDAVTRLP